MRSTSHSDRSYRRRTSHPVTDPLPAAVVGPDGGGAVSSEVCRAVIRGTSHCPGGRAPRGRASPPGARSRAVSAPAQPPDIGRPQKALRRRSIPDRWPCSLVRRSRPPGSAAVNSDGSRLSGRAHSSRVRPSGRIRLRSRHRWCRHHLPDRRRSARPAPGRHPGLRGLSGCSASGAVRAAWSRSAANCCRTTMWPPRRSAGHRSEPDGRAGAVGVLVGDSGSTGTSMSMVGLVSVAEVVSVAPPGVVEG